MLSGLINAGGNSTRMGVHKALLTVPVSGRALLEHVAATMAEVVDGPIFVAANHPPVQELARQLPRVTVVADDAPGQGPLAGIAAGLALAPDWMLALACDMPLLRVEMLRYLVDLCGQPREEGAGLPGAPWDVVVPVVDGRAETLCAVYHRRCLSVIQAMLRHGNLRIRDLFAQVNVRFVAEDELRRVDPNLQSFTNANTPQEWAAIRHLVRALPSNSPWHTDHPPDPP